jgi:hypothetical protein
MGRIFRPGWRRPPVIPVPVPMPGGYSYPRRRRVPYGGPGWGGRSGGCCCLGVLTLMMAPFALGLLLLKNRLARR